MTSHHLVHLVICLSVVQSSTYLLLLGIGYRTNGAASIFVDIPLNTKAVDPVVKALTLTDVVVGAAVTALLLALAVQAQKRFGRWTRTSSTRYATEMEKLAPLAVAGPFLIAALFAISMPLSRRRDDIVSIVTASAGVVFVGAMLIDVLSHDVPVVTWVGGWQPRAGIALGISMAFDPLSTSLALLAAVLVCAAFLFAWRYFETPGPIFHALVLVFGGAMAGFCLSGDLFNLFVFFELMSVSAYALTAYRSEESGPLQGALTFAVSNTVGAVFILFGIAILYARTGALNLAQIGVALSHGHADGLVVGAFAFLCIGFMVKAAVVPFHFWLADAYAVAPTPACVIFSA